jgi:hypothetical protein
MFKWLTMQVVRRDVPLTHCGSPTYVLLSFIIALYQFSSITSHLHLSLPDGNLPSTPGRCQTYVTLSRRG